MADQGVAMTPNPIPRERLPAVIFLQRKRIGQVPSYTTTRRYQDDIEYFCRDSIESDQCAKCNHPKDVHVGTPPGTGACSVKRCHCGGFKDSKARLEVANGIETTEAKVTEAAERLVKARRSYLDYVPDNGIADASILERMALEELNAMHELTDAVERRAKGKVTT